jgi:hypothetical protein
MDLGTLAQLITAVVVSGIGLAKAIVAVMAFFSKKNS